LLLGEIVDLTTPQFPKEVLVRWLAGDGTFVEKRLRAIRGLVLQKADQVLLQRPGNTAEWIVTQAIATPQPLETRVQRKRITLEGHDEVVLRCGEASVTLRRNGRLVLRGTYVESRSKGTNRIKGGSVLIN
jgi:hypothetical protein